MLTKERIFSKSSENNILSKTLPNIRLLISPCRSGSTMLINSLAQSDQIFSMYQPIKSDMYHEPNVSPYRVLYGEHPALTEERRKKTIFIKETIGHKYDQYSRMKVCEDEKQMDVFQTAFLFREPIATWRSWNKSQLAWPDDKQKSMELFITAYEHAYAMQQNCEQKGFNVSTLTLEHLRDPSNSMIEKLCNHWDIDFLPQMVNGWKHPLYKNPNLFYHPKEIEEDSRLGITTRVNDATSVQTNGKDNLEPIYVSPEEEDAILSRLENIYSKMLKRSTQRWLSTDSSFQSSPKPDG